MKNITSIVKEPFSYAGALMKKVIREEGDAMDLYKFLTIFVFDITASMWAYMGIEFFKDYVESLKNVDAAIWGPAIGLIASFFVWC